MTDQPYRIVIGLEVHVQLLTKTKLFCGCSTQFGLPPNTATCPVCLGLPGSLPVMNRRAFDLSLRAALALNGDIAPFTKWDRKNYYYPDLPKNYQISQYDLPFCRGGWLDIDAGAGPRRIGLIRVHLEEDAGKMLHDEKGGRSASLVDLNRTGTPLLEIVSQPDMHTPDEARVFLEELRLLLREIGVSDCEMQEGSLRCDANINVHVPVDGGVAATPIAEIKNLNSIRAVAKSLEYEADRQFRKFQADGKRLGEEPKETRGWDEARGVTVLQRRKEEASDYRYFPEPDLAPVVVQQEWLDRARSRMGELPAQQRVRLVTQYALSPYDAGVLTSQGRAFVAYFEEVARLSEDAKAASNWVSNQVLATVNEQKLELADFPLTAPVLAGLIREVRDSGLNMQRAREVYGRMLETRCSPREAMDQLGIKVVADEAVLREIVARAVAANPKAVADFKKGKTKAADAVKGAVMRETKGMARMERVQQFVVEALESGPPRQAISPAIADELLCDVLLFFATQTEKEQLDSVAKEMGIPFVEKSDKRVGTYYWMGQVGSNRVNAVKTRMGPFGHQGSAYQAIVYRTHSAATALVQLGMAFGIDRAVQKHGDVLVSRFIFPYDYRIIREGTDGYVVDYTETKRHPAKPSLLAMFDRERIQGRHPFRVHTGGLLSGGARIFSQRFLRDLVKTIEAAGISEFVGCEMEGAGLLSVSARTMPVWIVVKGISDFADDARHHEIAGARPIACRNAATFVLSALRGRVE